MQLRIKNIIQHIISKNIIGVLLLCTFLLSITPKQVLHSIAADHKDQPSKKVNDRVQFTETGFYCDCNSIVATSPYMEISTEYEIPNLIDFSLYHKSSSTSLYSSDHYYNDLRGPPSFF